MSVMKGIGKEVNFPIIRDPLPCKAQESRSSWEGTWSKAERDGGGLRGLEMMRIRGEEEGNV